MLATWIRASDMSFFEASIVATKMVLCLDGSCQSTESQLGLLKVWLSEVHLLAMSSDWRVLLCFLILKTHVSATWKTLLPIAAPMPPIKTSLPSSRQFQRVTSQFDHRFICINFILHMLEEIKYVCAPWRPAISWKIGPWVCWAVEKKSKPVFIILRIGQVYEFPVRSCSWNHLLCLLQYKKRSSNCKLQFLTEFLGWTTQQ